MFKSVFSAAFLFGRLAVICYPSHLPSLSPMFPSSFMSTSSSGLITTFGLITLQFFKTVLLKQNTSAFTAKLISGSLSFSRGMYDLYCLFICICTNNNTLYNSKSPIRLRYRAVLHNNNIIFTDNKF